MYLFRYRCQGASPAERLHNVSTTGVDFRGFGRIRADSLLPRKLPVVRGLKKGAPSRTCVNAVLHLQILSPRPMHGWTCFGGFPSGSGLRFWGFGRGDMFALGCPGVRHFGRRSAQTIGLHQIAPLANSVLGACRTASVQTACACRRRALALLFSVARRTRS